MIFLSSIFATRILRSLYKKKYTFIFIQALHRYKIFSSSEQRGLKGTIAENSKKSSRYYSNRAGTFFYKDSRMTSLHLLGRRLSTTDSDLKAVGFQHSWCAHLSALGLYCEGDWGETPQCSPQSPIKS